MSHYTIREKNSGTMIAIVKAENINQARSVAAELHLSVKMATSDELIEADKSMVVAAPAAKRRVPKVLVDPNQTCLEAQIRDAESGAPKLDDGPAALVAD